MPAMQIVRTVLVEMRETIVVEMDDDAIEALAADPDTAHDLFDAPPPGASLTTTSLGYEQDSWEIERVCPADQAPDDPSPILIAAPADLRKRITNWAATRAAVCEREGDGESIHPDEWHDLDDEASDIVSTLADSFVPTPA